LVFFFLRQSIPCSSKYFSAAFFRIPETLENSLPASSSSAFFISDGTRCDCLTDTHAIEFDFADGWAEAIGQSSYYSLQTDKKPGIVLILETIKERKYWLKLNSTIQHFNMPIDTWNIGEAAY
jgi:hypothetical protein